MVSEPDYPERVPTVPSMGGSIFTRTHGTNERSNKLAVAPLLDVSSSGADDDFFTHFFFKSNQKKTIILCVVFVCVKASMCLSVYFVVEHDDLPNISNTYQCQ